MTQVLVARLLQPGFRQRKKSDVLRGRPESDPLIIRVSLSELPGMNLCSWMCSATVLEGQSEQIGVPGAGSHMESFIEKMIRSKME